MPGRGCDDVMPGTCYCGAASVRISKSIIKHNNFSQVSRIIKKKKMLVMRLSHFLALLLIFFIPVGGVCARWSPIVCVGGNRWKRVEDWPTEV